MLALLPNSHHPHGNGAMRSAAGNAEVKRDKSQAGRRFQRHVPGRAAGLIPPAGGLPSAPLSSPGRAKAAPAQRRPVQPCLSQLLLSRAGPPLPSCRPVPRGARRRAVGKMGTEKQGGRSRGWAAGLLLWALAASGVSALRTASLVDVCGQTLRGDGAILTSHRDSRRFYFVATGTDCQLTLQAASPRDKVQFQFRFFLVYSLLRVPPSGPPGAGKSPQPPGSPWPPGQQEAAGPCMAGPYVRFYDGEDRSGTPLGPALCGTSIPRPVHSTGSGLTLRLVTRGQQPRVDFVGDFTSLRTGLNASACRAESYFPCRNGACIPPGLVCDGSGVDNCGDGTDQARCKGPAAPSPPPSAASVLPAQATCARPRDGRLLPPGGATRDDAERWEPLLASLAALAGAAVLYWCCWSPGWLLWRAGARRRRPGHGPAGRLCTCCRGHRAPARVAPQGSPEPPV